MSCNQCSSQGSERKFCTTCGSVNTAYDHANDGTEVDLFHDLECENNHPVLSQVQHAFPDQPYCNQCGNKV